MSVGDVKVIDFRKLEDKCGADKLEAFNRYIFMVARPGQAYKVIARDADTWYAIKELAREYGFDVLEEGREEDYYYVVIRLPA